MTLLSGWTLDHTEEKTYEDGPYTSSVYKNDQNDILGVTVDPDDPDWVHWYFIPSGEVYPTMSGNDLIETFMEEFEV